MDTKAVVVWDRVDTEVKGDIGKQNENWSLNVS